MRAIQDLVYNNPNALMIIFFGGYGEFGMNLTCYYYQKKLVAIDCGAKFPPPWMLGVECIVPQVNTIIDLFGGIHSYLITHAHEDHIGGLPYFYRKWPAPIYGTNWSISQITERFRKAKITIDPGTFVRVDPGDTTFNDHIRIEWVPIDHSTPMSCALFISTSAGAVFHTGDFKFDPIKKTGIDSIKRIGTSNVDLLISDSTNAGVEEKTIAENSVAETLEKLFSSAPGRILITSFSSNIERLQQVLDVSSRTGKKVIISGRGMLRAIESAVEHKLLKYNSDLLVNDKSVNHYADTEIVILASGSQGERRSSMYRIAHDEHDMIFIKPSDTILFSNRVIPGNELAVASMVSLFHKKGAKVITPRSCHGLSASGHATRDDLKELIKLLTPTYYIPSHGDFTQLVANCELAQADLNYRPIITPVENGTILTLLDGKLNAERFFTPEQQFIDSNSELPMSYETLRTRLKIGELGLVVVTGIFNAITQCMEQDICLDTFGLVFGFDPISESTMKQNLAGKISSLVSNVLQTTPTMDPVTLNEMVRCQLRQSLSSLLGKKPIVLSRIFLVSQ